MIQLPNISPLPFYKSLNEVYSEHPFAYGDTFPLITKLGEIAPFQICLGVIDDGYRISAVVLVDGVTNKIITSITESMIRTGLSLNRVENYSYIIYQSKGNIRELKEEGVYYITIYLEKKQQSGPSISLRLYSDLFCQKADVSECIKITYRNKENFSMGDIKILFGGDFFFEIYVNAKIGKPEYIIEEEGTKRGGVFFREFQMSKKRYHFGFPAPEYLCDAIRIIPMCDGVTIEAGNKTYYPIQISQDIDWLEQGNIAAVSVEFDTDNIITNTSGVVPNL